MHFRNIKAVTHFLRSYMFYTYLGTKNPKNSHPNLFFTEGINCLICQSKFRSLYPQSWNNFVPLSSTSISDRKRRKPHFYDSRLFIYIFRFFSLASGCFWTFYCFSWLYVHFLLPGSVFSSGFRMFLDFFLLFLCFMSILTGSAPYFSLVSGCFWTFLLLFSTLCPFSPTRLRISL